LLVGGEFGGALGGALGDKLGAGLTSPLGLALGSILSNPLGEDTVGAAEGARLGVANTLWVELGVTVRWLVGGELGAALRLPLGPALGSILRNPLGEDTVGAAEGARLGVANTLWVEFGVTVRLLVGGELGGALGGKLGAALILPLGLALGSLLRNPVGEDPVGAAEGASDTLWVELRVTVRLLLVAVDGAELGLELRLWVMLAFGAMLALGSADVEVELGIALGAVLALGTMLSLATTDVEVKEGIVLSTSLELLGLELG
jgi:hypothetical protein